MKRQPLALLVLASSLAAVGCASLNPTNEYPVISKTFGPNSSPDVGEAIAITADRRIVIVLVKPPKGDKSDGEWGRFCAEPPPDAASEVSRWFTASLAASSRATPPGVPASASGTLSNTDIQAIRSLFTRSQGIQMFRDGLYSLCQLYANGALHAKEVEPLFKLLLSTSASTVRSEFSRPAEQGK